MDHTVHCPFPRSPQQQQIPEPIQEITIGLVVIERRNVLRDRRRGPVLGNLTKWIAVRFGIFENDTSSALV